VTEIIVSKSDRKAMDLIKRYYNDPAAFCHDILKVELDLWQKQAFKNLLDKHFLVVRSGSGVGKTFFESCATMWFLFTRPKGKVPTTAPSQHQLNDVLWGEHFKRISGSPILNNIFIWTQTRVGVRGYEPEWYAVARTAQVRPGSEVAEGLQGFHCITPESEVLTDSGWKRIDQVDIHQDYLLTKNPDTNEAFFEKPESMFSGHYTGKMYHSRHQSLDFMVTPNHKIPYRSRTRKGLSHLKIDEIQNIDYSVWYIEDQFNWLGKDFDTFTLSEFMRDDGGYYSPPKELDAETWFKFLGVFVSEGHSRKDGLRTMIVQKDPVDTLQILDWINKLGFEYTVSHPRNDINMINIYGAQLGKHLHLFGHKATDKHLPNYVRNASPRLINAFLEGYLLGDGTINKNGARVFYTSSRQLAGDLQELIYKLGKKGSINQYKVKDSVIRGKLVTNCADRYIVTEYVRSGPVSITPSVNLELIDYDGDVYCPTMPSHHLFFMRRNGFCMWSGNSEKYLMFVIDEASGVPDAVYSAVEGALTHPEAYCLMCGNPTRRTGYFYDTFNNPAIQNFYTQMHVSCYDSPRVSERYIKMMEERYGKDHPVFLIKVLGEFPTAESELLIPPDFIEKMRNNSKANCDAFPIEFGVDIGRVGNSSILCARQGTNVIRWEEKHKPGLVTDTEEQVQWITVHIQDLDPQYVKVDAIGVGAGVFDGLHRLWGDRIVPVIGSATPSEEYRERYINLRAQGCWELRNLVPHLWCKMWPERLITEMSDIRTKSANKLKIESKDDMRGRAMKSPDHFDALWMAFVDSDACLHIKRAVFEFSSQHESISDMKKPSFYDGIGQSGSRFKKFRKAFHGTIH